MDYNIIKESNFEPKILIEKEAYDLPMPHYQTKGSSGMDLYAHLTEEHFYIEGGKKVNKAIKIYPQNSFLVPTGVRISIPEGFEGQVRSRSGLALKNKISVLNSPGTIDSDYTGEIKVILYNHGDEAFVIKRGNRIAQLVFSPIVKFKFKLVESLNETERGSGGFGSTGF